MKASEMRRTYCIFSRPMLTAMLFQLRYLERIPTRRREPVVLFDKNYVHITRRCSLGGATSGQAGLWTEPCGANVSSSLSRCTRWLAQKHAKKQHLYIKNYNSGPNMLTSTSLNFFIAIFLAFSGVLAEELMVLCRHVTIDERCNVRLRWHLAG